VSFGFVERMREARERKALSRYRILIGFNHEPKMEMKFDQWLNMPLDVALEAQSRSGGPLLNEALSDGAHLIVTLVRMNR